MGTWADGTSADRTAAVLESEVRDHAAALAPVFSVDAYGGGAAASAAANTTAINAAITAAATSGGVVLFGVGEYVTNGGHLVRDGVTYRGQGPGVTVVKLANTQNTDLFVSEDFGTYTGGTTRGGPEGWAFEAVTLDGNTANNTTGYPLKVFGAAYRLTDVEVQNGASGGVWSEWGTGGTDMEAHVVNLRVHDNDGIGLEWYGPHDSVFTNVQVFKNGSTGIVTDGNATSEQFANLHVWGTEHEYGAVFYTVAYLSGSHFEGASTANIQVNTGGVNILGGAIFGTGGANEVGVELGDGTGGTIGNTVILGTRMYGFEGTSARALKFTNTTAGSVIDVVVFANGASAVIQGTPSATDTVRVTCNDSTARSQESRQVIHGKVTAYPAASATTAWTWKTQDGTQDQINWNPTNGRLEFPNGTDLRFFTGAYTGQTISVDASGYVEYPEMSAPTAPSADRAREFWRDNGSGQAEKCVRLPSGTTHVMFTEQSGGRHPGDAVFSVSGVVATGTGQHRFYPGVAATIVEVRASVGTAPTGAALIVDVNKNGTTIFTTQSKRPQIAAAGFTDVSDPPDVTTLTTSDYLTFDVDQVGSTVPGSDLTVQVYLRAA